MKKSSYALAQVVSNNVGGDIVVELPKNVEWTARILLSPDGSARHHGAAHLQTRRERLRTRALLFDDGPQIHHAHAHK